MPGSFEVVRGEVAVLAKSSIHDTKTVWSDISGTLTLDVDAMRSDPPSAAGAGAAVEVDMTKFDAGDWLKNRKLKKDLDVGRHPRAEFALTELTDVTRTGDDTFAAVARGTMSWRGRTCPIEAKGSGTVTAEQVEAVATFTLDVTKLGVTPPKVLMFKVQDTVEVTVTLVGRAR